MATGHVTETEIRQAAIDGWIARLEGAEHLWLRPLGDGRAIYLCDMLLGNLRLGVGLIGSMGFEDVWCYQAEQTAAAWRAALAWDGEDEPEGWYRHPDTGRRRPGGDAAKEEIYW